MRSTFSVLSRGLALGWAYHKGYSAYKRQDYATVLELIRPLAIADLASAQGLLGVMYAKGEGLVRDDEQAVFWFSKSANLGDLDGQTNLGLSYTEGRGVPKNDEQAVFWFRKAADRGFAKAQQCLGWMYSNGSGVTKDDEQAVFWYRKAANQGQAKAQQCLGLSYAQGHGVTKDNKKAADWFRKAADQGSQTSKALLLRIEIDSIIKSPSDGIFGVLKSQSVEKGGWRCSRRFFFDSGGSVYDGGFLRRGEPR